MSKIKGQKGKKALEQNVQKDFSFPASLLWMLLLSLVTYLVYAASLKFELLNWDEKHYIYEQPMTRGLSWENIRTIFSKKVLGSYNPLVMISFAIDHDLSHSKASWYHGMNLFFHLINTLLLFAVARKLGLRVMIAGFIAMLFAIHPMHIESVAWVASRKDVLMGFFLFSSWWFYLHYFKVNKWPAYFFSILLFLLALLSKAQAVTFPIILILSDYLLNKSWSWKFFYNKIPYFVLSLVFGIIAISGSTFSADKYAIPLSLIDKISYSFIALWVYSYKLILPIHQSAIYAFPLKGSLEFIMPLVLSCLMVIFAGWYMIRNFKTKPLIVFALLFFLVNTFLTLHLVAVNSSLIYERFTYLSYIGLFFLIAAPDETANGKKYLPWILAVVCTLFAYLSTQRLQVWKNSVALWTDTLEKNPSSNEAYNNRGDYYNTAGNLDLAFDDFTNSTHVNPKQPNAFNNLAVIWFKRNQLDKALEENQKALDLDPSYSQATSNRGILYFNKGEMDSAIFYYLKALQLLPDYPFALCNLGSVYLKMEMPDSAIYYYRKALELQSNYPDASKYMGLAYFKKGNYSEAEQAMNDAQKMSSSSDAIKVLSSEYLLLASKAFHDGETNKAIGYCEKSIQFNPQNAEAYYNLGGYYMTLQNLAKTREYWKKALEINPNYKEARDWLDRIGG